MPAKRVRGQYYQDVSVVKSSGTKSDKRKTKKDDILLDVTVSDPCGDQCGIMW